MAFCDNKYCTKCKLHVGVQNPGMMGRGNKDSGVMIIGDFPTTFEDKHGGIFLGKHGKFIESRLDLVGLDPYYINAVKCPIAGEKKVTTVTQRSCCKPFTIKLIEDIKPKVIITLGQVPMQQLMDIPFSTKVLRGKAFYFPELNTYIVPTYQPKGIIFDADSLTFNQFRQDLELAKSILMKPPKRRIVPTLKSLSDPISIKEYILSLFNAPDVVIDLETDGLDSRKNKITDISLSSKPNEGIHIRWEHLMEFEDLFKQFLATDIMKCFHNAAFDREMLFMAGFPIINNIGYDTMLAFHTTNMSFEGKEQQGLYKLKTMAWFVSEYGGYEAVLDEEGGIAGIQGVKPKKEEKPKKLPYFWINEVIKTFGEVKTKKELTDILKANSDCRVVNQEEYEIFKKENTPAPVFNRLMLKKEPVIDWDHYATLISKRREERMQKTGMEKLPYYAALDALVTRQAMYYTKPEIDKQYNNVFYNLVMPLNYVLSRMRINGIRLDEEYMQQVKKENTEKAEQVKQEFFQKIGQEINLSSSPQIQKLLFEDMKIKPHPNFISATTKKPSANEEALIYYSEQYPELKLILDYRSVLKETSTYIDGFLSEVHPITGRIHPSYLQNSTATGRLSATQPPMQTIPRDNRIRNMVVPTKGWRLVSADLSQAELRVLAQMSNDDAMISAFLSGKDLHAVTACRAILGIDVDVFDKSIPEHKYARDVSKTINFGIVYGMSAYTLALRLGMPMNTDEEKKKSMQEAQEYIDKWFALYSGAKAWLDGIQEYCKQYGYVESLFGRRRYLHDIWSSNQVRFSGACRQAMNTPIQSTASDITCMGLIRMQRFLDENPKYRSMIVGVIHDDILIDSPEEEVEDISKRLTGFMTQNIPGITIPLVADPSVHERWTKD